MAQGGLRPTELGARIRDSGAWAQTPENTGDGEMDRQAMQSGNWHAVEDSHQGPTLLQPRPPIQRERWRTAGRGPDGKNQACQQQEAEKLRKGGGGAALNTKQEILKILYTNIQSVFSKINELAVQAVDQCPDIILLTETWCNASTSNATLAIPGY